MFMTTVELHEFIPDKIERQTTVMNRILFHYSHFVVIQ
jgi:hypothetical protein